MRCFKLPTTVAKSNVLDCLNQILGLLAAETALEVDGSQVQQIDTAGIALLIELATLTKANPKQQINLTNLSQNIQNMCALYQIKL